MPTTNPRMMITITHKTKEVLDRLAVASDKPASRWVSEMLDESVEAVFLPLLDALEVAKTQKSHAYEIINTALTKTQHNAAQLGLALQADIQTEKRNERKKNAKRK